MTILIYSLYATLYRSPVWVCHMHMWNGKFSQHLFVCSPFLKTKRENNPNWGQTKFCNGKLHSIAVIPVDLISSACSRSCVWFCWITRMIKTNFQSVYVRVFASSSSSPFEITSEKCVSIVLQKYNESQLVKCPHEAVINFSIPRDEVSWRLIQIYSLLLTFNELFIKIFNQIWIFFAVIRLKLRNIDIMVHILSGSNWSRDV